MRSECFCVFLCLGLSKRDVGLAADFLELQSYAVFSFSIFFALVVYPYIVTNKSDAITS